MLSQRLGDVLDGAGDELRGIIAAFMTAMASSGGSAGGLKIKNPACAAVKREAEENCTKSPA
jgi:hypothetical protein